MLKTSLFIFSLFLYVSCSDNYDWDSRIPDILKNIQEGNKKYDSSNDLKDLPTYDVIVVGSGSAGSTIVAKLLDKQPTMNILLLEAGPHKIDAGLYDFKNGAFWAGSDYDWKDETEVESSLGNRTVSVANGRVLGGTSAINFMYWIRGDPNDFNAWAKLTGDDSWSYDSLVPTFESIEKFLDFPSKNRGRDGDVYATESLTSGSITANFTKTIADAFNLPINPDYNSRGVNGVANAQINAKPTSNGNAATRQDAFTAQLQKHFTKKNLNILPNSTGDRVCLGENKEAKYFVFVHDGVSYRVRATKEIVLSSGGVRSPLILLRSGVGNCTELQKLNIKCKHDLPGVGNNLDYHPLQLIPFEFTGQRPTENIVLNIHTDTVNVEGFDLPKYQYIPYYIADRPIGVPEENKFFVAYFQCHPKSKGQISVRSSDPLAHPIIKTNLFQDPAEFKDYMNGIDKLLKIIGSLNASISSNFMDSLSVNGTLEEWVKETIVMYHFGGTCKMGRASDPLAVVDTKLNLLGVTGVRVADASIMPVFVSANPNSATMTIGARAAQEILSKYYQ